MAHLPKITVIISLKVVVVCVYDGEKGIKKNLDKYHIKNHRLNIPPTFNKKKEKLR